MKIQHSLLVSVFVIIAIGTLFMSIVKKETKKKDTVKKKETKSKTVKK